MGGMRGRDVGLLGVGVLVTLILVRAPLGAIAPLLLVGGCLLMHVWMMSSMGGHGHGGHGGHRAAGDDGASPIREEDRRW